MEILLAYGAGLLTLINPCVLPILPIVIASALQAGRLGPVVMAAGLSLSFVVLGVSVTAFGHLIGLDSYGLGRIGAGLMVVFGLLLLIPGASHLLERATQGLSRGADARIGRSDPRQLRGQFLGGLLLGAVWSPCIGPTLGGAIALASQGEALGHVTAIMTGFAAGVATLVLGLAYGTRGLMGAQTARLRRLAPVARPLLGASFLLVGLGLLLNVHHALEGWLLSVMPDWLVQLSVSL